MLVAEILKNITNVVVEDFLGKNRFNYSLLGGDFGKVLYLYYASKFDLCSISTANQCLDLIISSVKTNPVISTYCNGLSGLCIGLDILEKKGFVEGVSDSTSIYNILLNQEFEKHVDWNLDFLHGAIGIGLFHVMRAKYDKSAYLFVNKILEYLEKNGIYNTDGSVYWKYPNRYGIQQENLSLSHGISSTAMFISRAFKVLALQDRLICIRLLIGIGKYLKSHLLNPNILGSYTPMLPYNTKSRLGWCYGDIGTSVALRTIGEITHDLDLLDLSYEIAAHAAVCRNDLKSNYVFDACLCHGSSGIAHFFKNCFSYYNLSFASI